MPFSICTLTLDLVTSRYLQSFKARPLIDLKSNAAPLLSLQN
jgi:hypothetical protein